MFVFRINKWGAEISFTDQVVIISKGKYKGRIGYCDGDDGDSRYLIVYFGSPLLSEPIRVLTNNVRQPNSKDILERYEELNQKILKLRYRDPDKENWVLHELLLVQGYFFDRHENLHDDNTTNSIVFLSYSSMDRHEILHVANDLTYRNINVWLDEFEISYGENIISEVSRGIEKCTIMLVFLSKNSIKSQWVENEWTSKYSEEIKKRRTMVIPVIIDDLDPDNIPSLLKPKKHIKLEDSYSSFINELTLGIRKLQRHPSN